MNEFLSKDPDRKLFEVKEKLYERLEILRQCIRSSDKDDYGYLDPVDQMMSNEIEYIENLMDIIERS